MAKDFKELFQLIPEEKPTEGLLSRIIAGIWDEKRLVAARKRLALFIFGAAGSLVAFIPVLRLTQLKLADTGFLRFISLTYSDFDAVTREWWSYLMALLEALPIVHLVGTLALVFVFLVCLKYLFRDLKLVHKTKLVTN